MFTYIFTYIHMFTYKYTYIYAYAYACIYTSKAKKTLKIYSPYPWETLNRVLSYP